MTKTIKDYPLGTGTKQEVKEWFDSFMDDRDISISQLNYEDYDTDTPYKGYVLNQVASTGGSEGDGEYMDVTFAVESEDNSKNVLGYVQIYGRYNSWDSSEWEDYLVVKPKEVTSVEFFSV